MIQALREEIRMVKQARDSIVYSSLWNGPTKDTLILMDYLSSIRRKLQSLELMEKAIDIGVIEHWENEVEGLKQDQDGLNEFYRQFPRTEKHAFRDETKQSLFNLVKIYEQIDYNEEAHNIASVTKRKLSVAKWN